MNTNEPTTRTITKAAARVEVARLLGWKIETWVADSSDEWHCWISPDGAMCNSNRVGHFIPLDAPNCFEPGNAIALLFKLDVIYDWDFVCNGVCLRWAGVGILHKHTWIAETIEQFAIAAVAAFLTAHTGEKVIIED